MSEHDSLQLCKSLLSVEGGRLRKGNGDGANVASFDLDSITCIRCERYYDWPLPLIMFAGFGASAYVLQLYLETPLWRWLSVIVLVAMSLFSLSIVSSCKVVVETADGKAEFVGMESVDDVHAFVVSVNQMLRERHGQDE